MINKIIVKYKHVKLRGLDYVNDQVFDYTKNRRNIILDDVLDSGYIAQIRLINKDMIITINNSAF